MKYESAGRHDRTAWHRVRCVGVQYSSQERGARFPPSEMHPAAEASINTLSMAEVNSSLYLSATVRSTTLSVWTQSSPPNSQTR